MDVNEITNRLIEKRPMMFRNDTGLAYVGGKPFYVKKTGNLFVKKNDLIIVNPKRVKYGLLKGSADMIGWTPIIVTPDMIGQKIAVFTSCEIKTKNDRLSKEQRSWNRAVSRDGGIAEVWKEDKILKGEIIE